MIIGTVTATVHATISHEFYQAKRLLLVQREDAQGQPTGAYTIAIDTVDAGMGQRVLIMEEGTGARQIVGSSNAPVRSVIVGIVDDILIA